MITTSETKVDQPFEAKIIIDNMAALLENCKLTDVTLVSGGGVNTSTTEHKAHKAMLAAQSPVFAAMFEHDTKERAESRVEIVDLEGPVIQEMLRFIYTGKVPFFLDSMAVELLVAADKYALDQLKSLCEHSLISTLNTDNVVEVLMLADQHCAKQLRAKAIEFFKS